MNAGNELLLSSQQIALSRDRAFQLDMEEAHEIHAELTRFQKQLAKLGFPAELIRQRSNDFVQGNQHQRAVDLGDETNSCEVCEYKLTPEGHCTFSECPRADFASAADEARRVDEANAPAEEDVRAEVEAVEREGES